MNTVKASVLYRASLLQPFYGSKVVDASHNLMINALFKSSPLYVLTVNVYPQGAGSVTISPPLRPDGYPEGTEVTLTAIPNGRYVFAGWSTDTNGAYYMIEFVDNPHRVTMNSNITLTAIFELPIIPPQSIIFQIGKKSFYVDSVAKFLDVPPTIEGGRTLIPIRAIVEAFGGNVSWNGEEKKITIFLNSNTIELWINNPQAKINGMVKWIDESDHNIVPKIINGRTMIPLRFISENLGFVVIWNEDLKTITIKHLSKNNVQNTISIKKGFTYTITLDENPSTGFKWHYEISKPSIIQVISDKYTPSSNNIPGALGKHEWVIKGVLQGTATITFKYYRDSEPDKIDKVIIYEIIVE